MAETQPIDVLNRVPDVLQCILRELSPEGQAVAAAVCKTWCAALRKLWGVFDPPAGGETLQLHPTGARRLRPLEYAATPALMEWAFENGCPPTEKICVALAQQGWLGLLQKASTLGARFTNKVFAAPADRGDLGTVKWLCARDTLMVENRFAVCVAAARNGRLEILQWACVCLWPRLQRHVDKLIQHLAALASRHGHLNVLMWLWAHNWSHCSVGECYAIAAEAGHIAVLEWLLVVVDGRRELVSFGVVGAAMRGGHAEAVLWALKNSETHYVNADDYEEVWYWAVAHGQICILELLVEWGYECFDKGSCATAVKNRQFATLRWLRANYAPWSKKLCEEAAENGDLEIIKWAVAEGARCDAAKVAAIAEQMSLPEIAEWARANSDKNAENALSDPSDEEDADSSDAEEANPSDVEEDGIQAEIGDSAALLGWDQ